MSKVPQGSECVNTEAPNVDLPTVLSPPAISRRSILGSLAAACGFAATTPPLPLKSVPVDLLDAIAQPAVECVSVALGCGDGSPWLVAPTEQHIARSFIWRTLLDPERQISREYTIRPGKLRFFADGLYMPVRCQIDLEPDDTFRPDHLLSWPNLATSYSDNGEGWLRDGITIAEYGELDEIMSRQEALQAVAEANSESIAEHDGELPTGADWWVALEIGAEFKPSWIDPTLCMGVGKVEICLNLACRIAVPTANEVAHFGKGGV